MPIILCSASRCVIQHQKKTDTVNTTLIWWMFNKLLFKQHVSTTFSHLQVILSPQKTAFPFVLNNCKCAGHMVLMGEERGWGVHRVLVGKPEGKRPLGRPRRRWVDNILMDLQEVGCGYMDWIGLAQDRNRWQTLVSAVMNLRVPWNAGNFLTNCKPVSFSRRTLHNGVSK